MSHLLICGAAGYTNAGDDAILWGMLAQLQTALPGRSIRVAGGPELSQLLGASIATPVSYDDRSELARAIEEADLVILGGGGLLYDIGYDRPEAHVVEKDGTLYYGFFAPEFDGTITLRGLADGVSYTITDYIEGQDLGQVNGPDGKLNISFKNSVLLKAIPK